MKKIIIGIIIGALLLTGCDSNNKSKANTPTNNLGNQKLLFFMNPYGSPCIMQDLVLKKMGTELTDKAELVYIKTTEMETARQYFVKYGVRALPTLIVVDELDNIIKRFPPGVQNKNTIMDAI